MRKILLQRRAAVTVQVNSRFPAIIHDVPFGGVVVAAQVDPIVFGIVSRTNIDGGSGRDRSDGALDRGVDRGHTGDRASAYLYSGRPQWRRATTSTTQA